MLCKCRIVRNSCWRRRPWRGWGRHVVCRAHRGETERWSKVQCEAGNVISHHMSEKIYFFEFVTLARLLVYSVSNTEKKSFWERARSALRLRISRHPWADCLENIGSSTSHNPIGLHGLYGDSFTLWRRSVLSVKYELDCKYCYK
jgi:hypothetical protein